MPQGLDLEEAAMIERKRLVAEELMPDPFNVLKDIHSAGAEKKAKVKMKKKKKKK